MPALRCIHQVHTYRS